VGSAGLATLAGRLSNQPISLLVEGVESFGQLESCRRAGVRLLSGTLVSRPAVVSDRAIEPSQLACLRLMTALVRSDIDLGEIELAVRSDPALTMRVLKLVNSAGGARQRVSSIRQAVVLLGPRALLGCVISAGLSQGGTPTAVEAVEAVLVRARMCELLAGVVDGWGGEVVDGSAAFTVGMVASLDVLLGASPQDILGELPVDEAVENAVLFRGGPLGEVLADVLRYEGLEAPRLVDGGSLRSMHLAALGWAAPLTAPTSG
jgi:EAL and modified HD-GYP domain-containing signal transduction protein